MNKYSKYGMLFLLNFVFALEICGQDLIVNHDKDTIFCKILHVNDVFIKYQVQNDGEKTTNTLNRIYIDTYKINEIQATIDPVESKKKTNSAFRIAIAGGYANRLGKTWLTGDHKLDEMSKDLKHGSVLDAELQYFFNNSCGMALNINSNYTSTSGRDVNIPNFGFASNYAESQRITFFGPAFVTRYDVPKWLVTGSIGLGALFFKNKMNAEEHIIYGSRTSCGMNIGFSGEYKLSNHWGAGIKLGSVLGSTKSMNVSGQELKFDEALSLSSFFIAACLSFRTR